MYIYKYIYCLLAFMFSQQGIIQIGVTEMIEPTTKSPSKY